MLERSALIFLVANLKITLGERISSGRFGTVYKAQWQFAPVAAKQINSSISLELYTEATALQYSMFLIVIY